MQGFAYVETSSTQPDLSRFSEISPGAEIEASVQIEHPVHIRRDVEIQRLSAVGAFTFINKRTSVYEKVHISHFCSIGRNVEIGAPSHPTSFLSTHQFQFANAEFPNHPGYGELQNASWSDCQETIIGHDVWIGSGALVKTGVVIGVGAISHALTFQLDHPLGQANAYRPNRFRDRRPCDFSTSS